MNNANAILNAVRPTTQTSTSASSAASTRAGDDTTPSRHFDAVLSSAHAQTHAGTRTATHADHPSTHSDTSSSTRTAKDKDRDNGDDKASTSSSSASDKVATAKTDRTDGQDEPKKDDTSDDDGSSIASTMLALIGVPPKVTELASKALGALKGAAGKTGDLTAGALAMGLPSATHAAAAATAGDAGDGMLTSTEGAGTLVGAAGTAATASPLATLLAARAAVVGASKDDTATPSDPTTSPMPLAHTPGMSPVDGAVVQVQATQAATSPQFAQELGEQIAWMGGGEVKEARIKLHPEELGSMDVRVNVDGGKVNVAIMAQHPAAVHAVQQTLSQLDTMLAHHGLSLGHADVGQQQAGQGGQGTSGGQAGQAGAEDAGTGNAVVATSRVSRGLVDEVA